MWPSPDPPRDPRVAAMAVGIGRPERVAETAAMRPDPEGLVRGGDGNREGYQDVQLSGRAMDQGQPNG